MGLDLRLCSWNPAWMAPPLRCAYTWAEFQTFYAGYSKKAGNLRKTELWTTKSAGNQELKAYWKQSDTQGHS